MIRAQRHAHRLLWMIIGPLLLASVIAAMARRGYDPVQAPLPAAAAEAGR